jgi:diguanylate cyclase (GGDEF)-like protein/PAS domain S-box-containing protein
MLFAYNKLIQQILFQPMRNSTRPSLHADISVDSSRILDTLVNNLDGMVYRCRVDSDWTMLFVSHGCLELTGYAPEKLVESKHVSYEEITHVEDRSRVRQEIERAIAASRRFSIHYRIVTSLGEIKWVHERGAGVLDESGTAVIEGFIEDETAHKKMLEALQNAEHYYRHLVENAAVGIFQTSMDGHYLSANPTLARIYGYPAPDELIRAMGDIGRQLYVEAGRRDEFHHLMMTHGEVVNFESEVHRRDGGKIWISENAHVVRDVNGEFVCYEGTVHDITERKHHQSLLERQANYDALTGLLNRNLLHDLLEQGIARAARVGYFLAVVFVDLDNFKFINDSLGHSAGDSLLVEVAARLQGCLRASDTVVRQGGDEFVLVLNEHYRTNTVISLLERVLVEVSKPVLLAGRELQVGASLGVAIFPQDGNDSQTLLKHADAAMYAAKNEGRNNFQFFTSELNRVADERLNLENAMRVALEQDGFEVFFQPKTDAARRIVGMEALARWNTPEWGSVSPDRFIPIAEETGLIIPLTDAILRKAFTAASYWNAEFGRPLQIAVNLSPKLFHSEEIVRRIAMQMQASKLPAARIELEITESVFLGDSERTVRILHELKKLGVALALDDFGTGYSSLGYLRRFPLDIIKIDRSLVDGIERDEELAKIARAVISLGHSMGKTVVAEGVENQAQFDFLSAQGCHEFQGYLLARPMSSDAMSLLLRGLNPLPA